ncbi:hypothetical protein PsW64_00940 [Pseudovibrio sp. W64]|uniref:MarR family transcriptional regulator n=1 Tax=unclassified Pseudovibrio TaxID=2627060 RepID=UPI0007AE6DF6|nr:MULTISPECIES: MarR family transcriptional regulator [unclassified Pseudovibrio]KZK87643.1 hypothetical protein PsW64_00940 [Pseudovibrio sp. W64]KZK92511.1 hypothetical protein PsAD46_01351 [Pseudovibrio sp. Ad46]KZK98961.1 hypothetical protein PsAD5_01584 [Pseudovibrio sp. Ad5]KZL03157.1 hypothetical protein PsAD26_04678 [Pseudovibrio sp. Ad26]
MQAKYLADQLCEVSTALEDAVVQTYGELPANCAAILLLLRRKAAPSLAYISKQVCLSQSATATLVDRLEEGKLVRRMKREGRQVKVKLTAGGKRKADELVKSRRQAAENLLANLNEEQRTVLSKTFIQIMSGIDRSGNFEDLASLTAGRS